MAARTEKRKCRHLRNLHAVAQLVLTVGLLIPHSVSSVPSAVNPVHRLPPPCHPLNRASVRAIAAP